MPRVASVALAICALALASSGSAQALAGSIVAGAELPFVRYEHLERKSISVFDPAFEPSVPRTLFAVGLSPGAHVASAVDVPLGFATHVGYAFADAFVVGLRVGLGFATFSDDEAGSVTYWSLAMGPRAEYLFGSGWFRPFAGLDSAIVLADSTGDQGNRIDQSSRLWIIGPTGGVHVFVSDAVAFDLRATVTFGKGSEEQTLHLIIDQSITEGPSFMTIEQARWDVTRLDAVLSLGLSAWL